MYQIISSGSSGNAVLYHNSILLDCGISFQAVKPHIRDIQLLLLTHEHGDHINTNTVKRMLAERPGLRIGCGEHMLHKLEGINPRNIDIYEAGKIYDYGMFKVSPIRLYHDVPNYGYRIFTDDFKIIHATDTFTLKGISAKGYDLYALEHNYDEDTVWDIIREQEANGQFAHQRGSINSHLSKQQAQDFYLKNKSEHSQLIRLHESRTS